MNSVISSLVVPIKVGTVPSPSRISSTGTRGSTEPSTTGMNGRSVRAPAARTFPWAASSASVDAASSSATVSIPASASTERATSVADADLIAYVRAAGLHDRLREQALRTWRAEQCADAHPARGLAEDRHPLGVTAERGDVVTRPFEREDLVEDARVARTRERVAEDLVEVQEPERTEAVVDAHDDEVAMGGEPRAVVDR